MMRLMYFLDYANTVGGAVNTLFRQAMLMKERGHQIFLVVSDYMGNKENRGFLKILSDMGQDVLQITYQISSHTEDIDIVSVFENYDRIKGLVLEYKPDIIHSVQLNPVAELVSRELRIPHVMDIYQAIPEFFALDYLNIFPHYHICDSQLYADVWSQNLKTVSKCIRTVACKMKVGRKDILYGEDTKYICVGTVEKRKNQLEVIKAFQKALDFGISGVLTIYGYATSTYAQECKQYVDMHNLSQNIIFKGFCADAKQIYEDGDVLLCGSTMESYPNVISEALSCGTIVVSTPVAGVPEVIEDGKNGFLCKGMNAEDILDKILELEEKKKRNQLKSIRKQAYETYEAVHSPGTVSCQLENFYNDIKQKYENPWIVIQIDEVKKIFRDIMAIYSENIHKFPKPDDVKKKLWYLYHMKDKVKRSTKQFYIWGTGDYAVTAKTMLEVFFPEIVLNGFLDTYKTGRFLNYEIYHPAQIIGSDKCIVFIAAVNGQQEMVEALRREGRMCNKDYYILAPRLW